MVCVQTLDQNILPRFLAPSFYMGLIYRPICKRSKKTLGKKCLLVAGKLGPLFIKAGQFISTRPDLFSPDIIEHLSQLRDNVAPVSDELIDQELIRAFGANFHDHFQSIEKKPMASASIAQVHSAVMTTGERVVIKIRRPGIITEIRNDIASLRRLTRLITCCFIRARKFRFTALLDELESSLKQEVHLLNEAGHYAQMRRNFKNSDKLYVPKPYWDLCYDNLLVLERIDGVPVHHVQELKDKNVDLQYLAEQGVIIFFTQILRDSYFHADMHPGNIFIDTSDPQKPKYMAVDFGIMGYLSEDDRYYISQNLKAFFARDYRRIAELHIKSGWVPQSTRLFDFESSIRGVCEPLMNRPIAEISFARVLQNLLLIGQQYDMHVQPQLILLQKTLFNIEGLGRVLYPELNLWSTAKPFIDKMTDKPDLSEQLVQLKNQLPEIIRSFQHKPTHIARHMPPPKATKHLKLLLLLTVSALTFILGYDIAAIAMLAGFAIAL